MVACGGAYQFLLKPEQDALAATTRKINEKERLYNIILDSTTQQAKQANISKVKDAQDRFRNFVTRPELISDMTLSMNRIASQLKLDLFSTKGKSEDSFEEIANSKILGVNEIGVTFTSSFNQFASFLTTLERHKPVMLIDTFSISREPKNDLKNSAKLAINILTQTDSKTELNDFVNKLSYKPPPKQTGPGVGNMIMTNLSAIKGLLQK